MKREIYNTAFKASGNIAEKNIPFEGVFGNDRMLLFHHNICDGWVELFDRADAIHSEIAWRAGYEKFVDGTDAESTTFKEYIQAIASVCRDHGKPSFIVCGKQLLPMLKPELIMPITYRYHNYPAFYAVWNYEGDWKFNPKDEYEGRQQVADTYETILDPCCGYGIILETAHKAILSDINNGCLRSIADSYGLEQIYGTTKNTD